MKNRTTGIVAPAAAAAIGLSLALTSMGGGAHAQTPSIASMPGKPFLILGAFDGPRLGYTEEEFAVSGDASSYRLKGDAGLDGRWKVAPSGSAPYTTRIVVVRPSDPAKFNGTVVVEWLNVSGGVDVPVEWVTAHRELTRSGFAYVAVSAQVVGVEGGPNLSGGRGMPLKTIDPARYGKLSHPGDAYAYDIFSQVGRLLKGPGGGGVLGPLKAKHVIAVGESQSAIYLTTYVNAVDPVAKVYDGFLVHSRFGVAPLFDGADAVKGPAGWPAPVKYRSDLRVPVLTLITETDLLGTPTTRKGYLAARRPDSAHLRVWEIAGTAHADNYLYSVGMMDSGTAPIEKLAEAYAPTRNFRGTELAEAINSAPQHHYVTEAALARLDQWVRTGKAPPNAQPMEVEAGDHPKLVEDVQGNTLGGVRSPWVDAPTARLSGSRSPGPAAAELVGSTQPFDKAKLDGLYPGGRRVYLEKFEASLSSAIAAGFILPADREEILGLARASYQGSE